MARGRLRYARLGLFSEAEAQHLDRLKHLVGGYLAEDRPTRPLSIAIFGDPGSGKSTLAKALPALLGDDGSKLAKIAEINLTQIRNSGELASALDDAHESAIGKVPFVLFDEFDSKRDAAPWGWLSWFLAPMQDGVFREGARVHHLTKAVYCFAGGTASSFNLFVRSDPAPFGFAKGPDFVSRLSGFIDVPGINSDTSKILRRHRSLAFLLMRHERSVDSKLWDALMHVGRYRHGRRSMDAVVQLLPKAAIATVADVRNHPLLSMHLDRGPLDATQIGGNIWVSGADRGAGNFAHVWNAVARALFGDGATLCLGGRNSTGALMQQLERAVLGSPARLEPSGNVWINITRQPTTSRDQRVNKIDSPKEPKDRPPAALPSALKKEWRAALKLFRLRHRLATMSVAHFAITGTVSIEGSPSKRFPGVVEELMLSLALRHPVYIAGGYGGGAAWAGRLLGLGAFWLGELPGFETDPAIATSDRSELFRPPPFDDLPTNRAQLIAFLRARALGGDLWVDNGLTEQENRTLYSSRRPDEIAGLVVRGLRHKFR